MINTKHLPSLFLVIVSFIFILTVTNGLADTWKTERVDVTPKYFHDFYSRAIAVDTSGNPHIAYGGKNLYYAYYDGSAWRNETVDSSYGVGEYPSIVVDNAGKIHISYFDDTNGDLKYATNATGSWVTTVVDSDGGWDTSIALDASGKLHISYYDITNEDLKYATNASGTWTTSTLDSDGDVGLNSSIALDASGNVHISYYDNTNHDLKYATNTSGTWTTTTVDTNENVGWDASIALDTSDKAHISYYDNTNYDLKYATNISGTWATTTVDSAGDVGEYSSIGIDASGTAHISYYDWTNGDLKYATNPGCEAKTILVSPGKPEIKVGKSKAIVVTVKGDGDCLVEGATVNVKIDKSGTKKVSVSEESVNTNENGEAVFTITGVKKGKAKITFSVNSLEKKITVKVK